MKSIKCKLIRYREKFYVIFDDNRDIKIGDLVLTECLIPEGRVVNIFSDYENFGFYSVDNSPVKRGGAKSIIAASDNEIEKRFKDNYTGEKTCYLYEVDNNVLLNYDKTVVLTFDTLNFEELSTPYKPKSIGTLLIAEAPPSNCKKYFYLVSPDYKPKKVILSKDYSLPSTIFGHYFGKAPCNPTEYNQFLYCLMNNNIFLIDLFEAPIQVRNNLKNTSVLVSDENIARLKYRINDLINESTRIIFLLARNNYKKVLQMEFPSCQFYSWLDFRKPIQNILNCP